MKVTFLQDGAEAIVCTAIHNGHEMRGELIAKRGISEADQLREEDPFTGLFTEICPNRVIVETSRFEVDLNRSRERAVYMQPQDAWGLPVRSSALSTSEVHTSLQGYDDFYTQIKDYIDALLQKQQRIFVYDVHSYNHHRQGPEAPFDDPAMNPEIILGTNTMPLHHMPMVEAIRDSFCATAVQGHLLDARINVKFPGGHFSRWLHSTFGERIICVAIEFRKDFMDEWSNTYNAAHLEQLRQALAATFPIIKGYLKETSCQ